MNHRLNLLASLALLPMVLPAQGNKKLVPDPGNKDGNTSSYYFSVYGAGRTQQITLGAALCNTSAVLFELGLRADGASLTTLAARKFSTFKLSLGYTSIAPSNMSTTFATNRTGTQTLMFSGAFNLPAQNATTRPFNINWKFAKPYIYTRSGGNLLVEFEIPVVPQAKVAYYTDAHVAATNSGTSSSFGTGGKFSATENYTISCANNGDLRPGGNATMVVGPLTQNYPAVSIWGVSRTKWGPINLPLDLGGLGATGNFLNVTPTAMFGMPLTQKGSIYEGKAGLPIPNDKRFQGQSIFSQALLFDAKANTAGMVFSQGLSMTMSLGQAPAQLLGHYDYKRTTGDMPIKGGGLVIEFTGSFN